ncbi:Kinetochore-associated Ndc80 complex component [Komagataella phaffii CBS 7435]|uniref:Component of the evolutionarily conserved kinetochore-associated Ndc80 complex n=2 Tax=Komagataella phaffii TaxID=460519 RepID=C4QVN1_KOMPG|nr:Component of the evolutionarily conserved kinetochore-associated Ndc80 complex [Komagataella phaffii GS115]AOA61213.1 GQ67_02505T0 [Komagataella phaffii]CAH2445962.1 Kinetochore-associated Ndc80 complex component [Komagataella phaffii CBS 7435]AOA65668.1 GQ68_02742T0 [Komagataella phaffii GS115]CAY67304.1 Component of the evolutionarily conserved kinetochore-associated Ndc80 complex [Komagataella phaffii GS115]CCA36409.1 Kinetochore-associated Ndc80 complex component [Komagataella phaffii C
MRKQYIFPILDIKELVMCLQSCGFTASEDLIGRPTREYVQTLLEQVADQYLGISSQVIYKIKENNKENNSVHVVIYLQRIMYQFLKVCGIDDFNIMDIMKPDSNRVLVILSGIVNFARFREEHLIDCESFLNTSEQMVKEYKNLEQSNEKMKENIEQLKQGDNDIDKINKENKDIENKLKSLISKQEELTQQRLAYKEERINLIEKLRENDELIGNLRQFNLQLQEESSTSIKTRNQALQEQLNQEQTVLSGLELKSRNLSVSIESFSLLNVEVENYLKLMRDVEAEVNKQELLMEKLGKHGEALETDQLKSNELKYRVHQLSRQLNTQKDKIDTLKTTMEEKRKTNNEKLTTIHDQYTTLIAERDLNEQDLNTKKNYIDSLEQKMSEMSRLLDQEVQDCNLELLRLNSHLKLYLKEMEKTKVNEYIQIM